MKSSSTSSMFLKFQSGRSLIALSDFLEKLSLNSRLFSFVSKLSWFGGINGGINALLYKPFQSKSRSQGWFLTSPMPLCPKRSNFFLLIHWLIKSAASILHPWGIFEFFISIWVLRICCLISFLVLPKYGRYRIVAYWNLTLWNMHS